MISVQVAIVGGGLSGLTLGRFLTQQGLDAVVFEPHSSRQDKRSLVLTRRSVQLLSPCTGALSQWAQPIQSVMLMSTGTRFTHHIRPDKPQTTLGQVIPAARLYQLLQSGVSIVPQTVTHYQPDDSGWVIESGQETYHADCLVFASGSLSVAARWGLPIERSPAEQSAAVMTWHLAKQPDHQAIECLLPSGGALTLVPRGRGVFGGILIDATDHVQTFSELSAQAQQQCLAHWLSPRWQGQLIESVTAPQVFPLTPQRVLTQVSGRAAFIGHAAHIFHPIAAQGYNTTVYEAHALAQQLSQANAADYPKVLTQWDVTMQQHHRQLEWVMRQLTRGLRPRPAWLNGLAFQAMRFTPTINRLWSQLSQGLSV